MNRNNKILRISGVLLLIAIVVVAITIPVILKKVSTTSIPMIAVYALMGALAIRILIFVGYLKIIRDNKHSLTNRRGEYIGIGALIMIFALVYMDGAIAYSDKSETMLLSVLMFITVICEMAAALLTIVLFFLKLQK